MYKEGGHELLLSPSCSLLFLLSLLNGSGPCDKLGLISCWFCCSSFILSHPLSLSLFDLRFIVALLHLWLIIDWNYQIRMRECVPHIREHVMTCAILRTLELWSTSLWASWTTVVSSFFYILTSLLLPHFLHFCHAFSRSETVSFVIEVYVYRSLIELESFSNCLAKCGSCIIIRAIKMLLELWGRPLKFYDLLLLFLILQRDYRLNSCINCNVLHFEKFLEV